VSSAATTTIDPNNDGRNGISALSFRIKTNNSLALPADGVQTSQNKHRSDMSFHGSQKDTYRNRQPALGMNSRCSPLALEGLKQKHLLRDLGDPATNQFLKGVATPDTTMLGRTLYSQLAKSKETEYNPRLDSYDGPKTIGRSGESRLNNEFFPPRSSTLNANFFNQDLQNLNVLNYTCTGDFRASSNF